MPRVTFVSAESPSLGSIEVDGVKLRLGQTETLTDRQLERARSIPGVRLDVADHDLARLNRWQLNELASTKGVQEPHKLSTKAAVIEAIGAIGENDEPEGDETDG